VEDPAVYVRARGAAAYSIGRTSMARGRGFLQSSKQIISSTLWFVPYVSRYMQTTNCTWTKTCILGNVPVAFSSRPMRTSITNGRRREHAAKSAQKYSANTRQNPSKPGYRLVREKDGSRTAKVTGITKISCYKKK